MEENWAFWVARKSQSVPRNHESWLSATSRLHFSGISHCPLPDCLWGVVQVSCWKQAQKKNTVSGEAYGACRDLWEQDGMGVRRTAGGALGLSHTWRWDGKNLWSGDFLRSSFFMDLCSLMRNALNFIQKKKEDRNSASCNVMCFGRGALNKLDMVDNFISFTPPTIIFSQLAKICFVNQRNPSNSSCSEQDRYKKGGLSGRKRAALCEKGEQGSAFLYVLPILCSLVTSWDHDWRLQPSIAECLLAASRWFLPQKSSPVASMCMLKEGDARLHGAGWGKHMQWHLVFPCEEQTSCFTYLPSAMRGQEPSSLENREQACS